MPTVPGARTNGPGVYDLGGVSTPSEPSYFGIWDVKANRADVFSSPQADETLGRLVQKIDGESGGRKGLAWVIRHDRTAFSTPWSPDNFETKILPGDLVVLPNHRDSRSGVPQAHSGISGAWGAHGTAAANSAESDHVQVAFVGLEARRPIIVSLPKRQATIADVLEQLHQRAELGPTVHVIHTDAQRGRVSRDRSWRDSSPIPLVDGDVLVFNRSRLDAHGLAIARANWAFPDSRPLDLTRDAVLGRSNRAAEEADRASDGPLLSDAHVPGSGPRVDVSTPERWRLDPTEDPAPPARAPREDAVDLPFGEELPTVTTAEHYLSREPNHFSQTTALAPAPIPAVSPAAESTDTGSLKSLNTLTIAVGVLALAALCFMVSVAWTRIDRTAHALQQSRDSGGTRAGDGETERKTLDQLIDNSVPMIEEQAHLPDRMDYFGPELGRKRMIIDPPHEVAGPHFAVTTDKARTPRSSRARRSSRAPVATTAAAQQQHEDTDNSRPEARLARAALQIRQLHRRRARATPIEPNETRARASQPDAKPRETSPAQSEPTIAELDQPEPSLPRVGLLERVLIAMERERRP